MSSEQLERALPTAWYLSPVVFQAEKERISCREWIGVCRQEEVQNPGDSPVLDLLGA
jgi:phenylpropionate dioxygenase-like ring-hydroxylating dioxygenase large terminal subunit